LVKTIVSHSIDRELMKKVERYKEKISKIYPGISRSAVIEMLLREALPQDTELSIAR